MTDKAFHGVFPYLVSPIRYDGAVDRGVLGRLCDDLIEAGAGNDTILAGDGDDETPTLDAEVGRCGGYVGDGLDAELTGGTGHTQCNFTSIGDQNFTE